MHKHLQIFLAILLITLASAARADLIIVEEAFEMQPIDLQLTSDSSGLVYANNCDGCKPTQLIVTRATKVSFAGKPLALTDVKQYAQLGGTVFYDKTTRTVTRIVVWQ